MAIAAYGNIRLKRGDGASTEAFTTIAGVKSVNGPNTQLSFLESTDFDSTGGFREFVAGLRDPGQGSFTLNFGPTDTGHTALLSDHDAGTLRNFRLEFGPSGTPSDVWGFAAYIESIGPTAEVDGLLEAEATLRVSGVVNRAVS